MGATPFADKALFDNFLKQKDILIVDKTPASRTRLIKLFNQMGMKLTSIKTTSSLLEAKEIVETGNVGIVLSDYMINGGSGFDLFRHIRQNPKAKKEIVLVLVTSNGSQNAVAKAAEEDVDAFVIKPYTTASIEETLISAVKKKVNPSQYIQIIEKAKEMIFAGDYDGALIDLDIALTMNSKPTLAKFYIGQANLLKSMQENAKNAYQDGLNHEKIHFKCLIGLFELLIQQERNEQAYEVIRRVAKYFPSSPERFVQVVDLCVRTGSFQDMAEYYELYTGMEERTAKTTKYIGAGLYVSGKHFLLKGELADARKLFNGVLVSCSEYTHLLRAIIRVMVENGLAQEAEAYLMRFPDGGKDSVDYIISDFLITSQMTTDSHAVVRKGMDIFNRGIRDNLCIQTTISAMKKANYPSDKIAMIASAITEA